VNTHSFGYTQEVLFFAK